MAFDVSGNVASMYEAILAHAQSKSNVLITDGQDLAMVLLLITLSWAVLMWILSSDGAQALVEAFGALARYAVVTVMLTGWLGLVGGSLQANVIDIAQKVAGTSTIRDSVDLMFRSAERMFADKSADRLSTCKEIESPDPNAAGGVSRDTVCEGQTGRGSAVTFMDVLFNLPLVLAAMLFKLGALIFMTMFLAAFLLVIFMQEILFGIALALGPILVPWLIWQRTEWLFDGWLRFTLAACFTKIVAFIMIGFVTGVIKAAKVASEAINVESASDMLAVDELAALLMMLCAAVGAFMMWQVPSIAGGLLSGSGGAGAKGFGKGSLGTNLQQAGRFASNAPGLQNDAKAARQWLAEKAGRGEKK
jgi:type IV secretory pathway VirB6-like protein